jgi:hypothetical protein
LIYTIGPPSHEEVEEMPHSIKGHSLLEGAREKNHLDHRALSDFLVHLSCLAMKEEIIQDIDLNPIFQLEKGFYYSRDYSLSKPNLDKSEVNRVFSAYSKLN